MTIDISKLSVGQICPCGTTSLIDAVDRGNNQFRCFSPLTGVAVNHVSLGPGCGYSNLNNVSVTPPTGYAPAQSNVTPTPHINGVTYGSAAAHSAHARIMARAAATIDRVLSAPVENRFAYDPQRFPHVCPACKGPAYVGFSVIEHAANGKAGCP